MILNFLYVINVKIIYVQVVMNLMIKLIRIIRGITKKIYFLCKEHFIEFSSYWKNGKKDICSLCTIVHEYHKLLAYWTIKRELDIAKDKELKDIKELIYQIKIIVNEMIYQLNTFYINLDTYFEI